MIQSITNFMLCKILNIIGCPSRLCMGKSHLKIRYHKRGLSLKKDCVMNMTVLRHEYKGGCILTFYFVGNGGGGQFLWV